MLGAPKSSQETPVLVSAIKDTGRSLEAQSTPGASLEEEGQVLTECSRGHCDVNYQVLCFWAKQVPRVE